MLTRELVGLLKKLEQKLPDRFWRGFPKLVMDSTGYCYITQENKLNKDPLFAACSIEDLAKQIREFLDAHQ